MTEDQLDAFLAGFFNRKPNKLSIEEFNRIYDKGLAAACIPDNQRLKLELRKVAYIRLEITK